MSAAARRVKLQQIKVRERRVQAQKAKATKNPDGTLNDRGIGQAVAAATRQKFGGAEQQLGGEVNVSGQMQANIGNWFSDAMKAAQGAQTSSGQGYQTAADQLAQVAAASRGNDAAAHASVAKELSGDAAIRGTTADTNDGTAAQADTNRQSLLQALAAQVARQGASANDYFGGRVANAGAAGAQAHTNELNNLHTIQGKQRDLKSQEGDYKVTQGQAIRDAQQKYGLELSALGLKQSQAQSQQDLQLQKLALAAKALKVNTKVKIRGQNTSASIAQGHDQTTQRGQNLSHADRQAAIANRLANKGKPTRKDRINGQNKYRQALTFAQRDKPAKGDKMKYVAFLETKGIPNDLAEAAVQSYFYKGVNSATRKTIHQHYGIKLPAIPPAPAVATPPIPLPPGL